jgi:hypothetical protein
MGTENGPYLVHQLIRERIAEAESVRQARGLLDDEHRATTAATHLENRLRLSGWRRDRAFLRAFR